MNKCLKALENIKREAGIPYFSTLYDIDMWREDFATIEKGLKKLEELENITCKEPKDADEILDFLLTRNKALEIIKRIDFSLEFDESQNEWFLYISIPTQDGEYQELVACGAGVKTYELLKEVL